MVEIENCFSQLSILAIENYCILQPNLDPLNDKSVAQIEKQHCFTMESEVACLVINWIQLLKFVVGMYLYIKLKLHFTLTGKAPVRCTYNALNCNVKRLYRIFKIY